MKFKYLTLFLVALGVAVVLPGCGGGSPPDPKSLGFNDAAEMKSIQTQGWYTKQRYDVDQKLLAEDQEYAQQRKLLEEKAKAAADEKQKALHEEYLAYMDAQLGLDGLANCRAAFRAVAMLYLSDEKYRTSGDVARLMKDGGVYSNADTDFKELSEWVTKGSGKSPRYSTSVLNEKTEQKFNDLARTGSLPAIVSAVYKCNFAARYYYPKGPNAEELAEFEAALGAFGTKAWNCEGLYMAFGEVAAKEMDRTGVEKRIDRLHRYASYQKSKGVDMRGRTDAVIDTYLETRSQPPRYVAWLGECAKYFSDDDKFNLTVKSPVPAPIASQSAGASGTATDSQAAFLSYSMTQYAQCVPTTVTWSVLDATYGSRKGDDPTFRMLVNGARVLAERVLAPGMSALIASGKSSIGERDVLLRSGGELDRARTRGLSAIQIMQYEQEQLNACMVRFQPLLNTLRK